MNQALVLAGCFAFALLWVFILGSLATGGFRDGARYVGIWLKTSAAIVVVGAVLGGVVFLVTWPFMA
jgi:hypothetical protein